MIELSLVVQWIVRLIPHGAPIELFLIPISASKGHDKYYLVCVANRTLDAPTVILDCCILYGLTSDCVLNICRKN